MFLIDRPAVSFGLRADLAPQQLFGGAGELVRAALMARPPVTASAVSRSRRSGSQLDLALPAPARRRKAG